MKTYKDAGVDIDLAEKLVQKIKQLARKTFNERVLADIGLFGAFYDVKFEEYKHPVLVSSVDGVGTKLKIAFLVNKHDTIGQDLVNHCVNDILVCGAKPLFFLDYFATGKLNIDVAEQVIYGLAKACEENNCTLIGGETAEMPGFYQEGEYDLAGTIVGIVEKEKIIKGDKVKDGDILIALPSTGLHTNGYSLARMILLEKFKIDEFIPELNTTLAEELLKIHRSYLKPILKLLSYFIYADGINTVIIFASIFARHTLNFSLVEILTFFLSVQSTAILGSVIFGIIADSIGQKKTLSITLLMWVATAIGAYFCTDKISFYIIGFIAGAAMGSSQSTSRSLMSKIIPPEKKTEFFGFYSFFGKSSAILGPLVFGFVSSITGSQRIAVISVALFFVVGLILLQRVREERFKG